MRIDSFLSLIINNLSIFYIKLVLFPCIILLLLYIIYMVNLKLTKSSDVIVVSTKKALLNSIIQIVFIYSIIFFFILKYNGFSIFKWSLVNYRSNIIIMLLPLIVPYIILLFIYLSTEKSIKKII
jgi:hypothetical protein